MSKSAIEWTDHTWSPVTGCTKVSAGCTNCYAEREVNTRWSKNPNSVFFGRDFSDVQCQPDQLATPLRWRKPQMIFVCPRADLFHESVPDDFIDHVFAVMALAPQHTFQVLTKRPERMREYLSADHRASYVEGRTKRTARLLNRSIPVGKMLRWPLPHVWLGVTVENQAAADERIPLLLQTPAAVRWISVEPMIGPISFVGMFANPNNPWDGTNVLEEIDWVVCGGESGKNARPMHSDWARQLRDCCAAVDVPFMFKQWGEWVPLRPSMDGCAYLDGPALVQEHSPKRRPKIWPGYSIGGDFPPWMQAMRVGKKAAGRLIDGVLHDEYPQQKKERSHER